MKPPPPHATPPSCQDSEVTTGGGGGGGGGRFGRDPFVRVERGEGIDFGGGFRRGFEVGRRAMIEREEAADLLEFDDVGGDA
jgi:hypothetical protein